MIEVNSSMLDNFIENKNNIFNVNAMLHILNFNSFFSLYMFVAKESLVLLLTGTLTITSPVLPCRKRSWFEIIVA